MDKLKEFLEPKTFNKLSYIAAVCWIIFGVILLSVFADIENSEARFDFRCGAKSEKKDLVRGKCFERYEHQYNRLGVPVYGFVIMNFVLVGIACIIYSQAVKSRVELLETRDAEGQRPDTRRLFVAYCCQLAARLTLVTLFIVLQTRLFYPSNFPSDFNCHLTPESSHAANTSAGRNTTTYQCHNQRAGKKTFWTNTMIAVNGIFAVLFLIEMIWILARAGKNKKFLEDSQFVSNHLNSNPAVNSELQELTQLLSSFTENMKKSIIEDTETPTDLKALFQPDHGAGERIEDPKLDSIYTKLQLIPNRAVYYFTGDREKQLKVYPAPRENCQLLKGPEDIVDAENKMILLVGRPGIGKTLFCTKFMRDWANGKVFKKTQNTDSVYFDLAFFVKFRRFNSVESLSLRELLARSEYSQTEHLPDGVWTYIRENPDKVLILLDGLDEFKDIQGIVDETVQNNCNNNVEQTIPPAALFSKITNGKLLSGATVVTTTRPTAVSSIKDLPFQKTIEIIGFAFEQVEEYAKNFSKEEAKNVNAGEKIWEHISTNMNLLSLCYIPVNCKIICSCLTEILKYFTERGEDLAGVGLPTKLTEIYMKTTKLFFFRHNDQYRDKPISRRDIQSNEFPPEVEQNILKPLGKVAFKGIKERRLIFVKSEVQGLEDSGLFHQLPDRKIDPFKHETQFCFIHLTMQEFFAARHIVDTMKKKELRRFVSDHIKEGEWHVVLQFVAGLLGERKLHRAPINIFTNLLPVQTKKEYGFTYWPTDNDEDLALTIIKCLFECESKESHSVVKSKLEEIGFNAVEFHYCSLAPSDCTAVVHALKNVPQIFRINLYNNHIGSLHCVEIRKLLDNGNCQITELDLINNNIDDNGVLELWKGITNSKLTELNLTLNKITDVGVNNLCDVLINPNCKLTVLDLSNNKITDVGVNNLCDVLTNPNCKLTWLDLINNKITDVSVNNLCDVLTNPNCKLTRLYLGDNEAITTEAKQRITNANPNCLVVI